MNQQRKAKRLWIGGVVRVFELEDGGFQHVTLIHTPDRDTSQISTLSKKRQPRNVSKKERRHKKSTERQAAADKLEVEEQHKIMNDIIHRNEGFVLCLPCCAEAYEDDMSIGFFNKTKTDGKEGIATNTCDTKPLMLFYAGTIIISRSSSHGGPLGREHFSDTQQSKCGVAKMGTPQSDHYETMILR